MFTPTRDQARQFLVDSWAKYRARQPLQGLEDIAVAVVAQHPEYHSVLEHPQHHVARDYTPESGEANPFLHLTLHLAVAEQLSIDQPRGIRHAFERIKAKKDDEHAALHTLLECLGEMIWQAQRQNAPPDAGAYLRCLEKQG